MTYSSAIPDSWIKATLGDVLVRIEAGKSFRCEARPAHPGECGVIKVSAMTYGTFREQENKAVVPGTPLEPSCEIKTGDILLSRANTEQYVGASVLVRECRPGLFLSDKSLRLVPSLKVDRHWLSYLLSSPEIRKEISRRATGTKDSMRNISQKSLREIQIRIPPLAEQCRIVVALEDHLDRVDRLTAQIRQAVISAERLRRSLLAGAFAGRLVEQDPSDEPVAVMLEHIRAGHAHEVASRE